MRSNHKRAWIYGSSAIIVLILAVLGWSQWRQYAVQQQRMREGNRALSDAVDDDSLGVEWTEQVPLNPGASSAGLIQRREVPKKNLATAKNAPIGVISEESKPALEKVIQDYADVPAGFHAAILLGHQSYEASKYSEAIERYRQAREMARGKLQKASALRYLAATFLKQGDCSRAIETAREGTHLSVPTLVWAFNDVLEKCKNSKGGGES